MNSQNLQADRQRASDWWQSLPELKQKQLFVYYLGEQRVFPHLTGREIQSIWINERKPNAWPQSPNP